MEVMLMIEPRPVVINGTKARMQCVTCVKFSRTSASWPFSFTSRNAAWKPPPALLTRMSTAPKRAPTCSAKARTRGSSRTSKTSLTAVRDAASISRTAAARFPASRSHTATWAPKRAIATAIARPMPTAAPVTTATQSVRRMLFGSRVMRLFCTAPTTCLSRFTTKTPRHKDRPLMAAGICSRSTLAESALVSLCLGGERPAPPLHCGAVNVLAIDQGTSSTKALVVGPDGAVLAEAEAPVHPQASADGGVEQNPEELLESVLSAGRHALAQAGAPVSAIGLANQGETVLAWDRKTGQPLSAAISWQDRRALAICDALRERAERLQSLTGLPLDPYFAAPKIRWLREHVTREGVCTTTDAWLLRRLCGTYVTDAATASRTLLLDLATVTWSREACALFDVDADENPAIVPCAAPIGETSAFGTTLPVAGLAVDQQAALFGEGCLGAGEAKCTYGTGAFLLATVGQ